MTQPHTEGLVFATDSIPEQLWQGEWVPAPDQPIDAEGNYRPRPPAPTD
jgi:hypothetical protein